MTAAALTSRPNTKPHAYEATSTERGAAARLKSLPASAQQKFEHLRQLETRVSALRDGLYEQQQRVRESRDLALRDLGIFDRRWEPEATFTYEEDERIGERKRIAVVFPERVALVEKIEALKSELARLADEQRSANLGYSTPDLLDWLASQSPSTNFVVAPVSPIKLAKAEALTDALARNREAQATINAERATAHNAGRTVAETKAAMRGQVDLLAEKGRPDVANLFHGGAIVWPSEQFVAGGQGVHEFVVSATVNDALSLTVWAHRAAITAQLDAEIERAGDDANALSAEAQAARIAECEAALLQLQRQQETIIERLEGDGIRVHRTCADPIVLLGIEQLRQ